MLRQVCEQGGICGEYVKIASADFPTPFRSQLEFNAPSRGAWNIVQTGMLLPQAHQIYICALGCLRGVIMTAGEMNLMNRMSWVAIEESDIYDGSMEQKAIDGVTNILNRLEEKPRAVFVYLSCIQIFAGCDCEMIVKRLSEKFEDIKFIDSYMTPTMQKSGMNPEMLTRKGMYDPLEKRELDKKSVNIIGNDRATDEESMLVRIIKENGFTLRDITLCKDFDEYLEMGESFLNITYLPTALMAGESLEKRLSQKHLYIPLSYNFQQIIENYNKLFCELGIEPYDFHAEILTAQESLKKTREKIKDVPISVDYTATPRPLGLCRLLLDNGFNVKRVYLDSFSNEEKEDFFYLKENFGSLEIGSTVNVKMRFVGNKNHEERYLAIGQKSAYFDGTDHFVNIVSGGGFYGFVGISKLCEMICDAYENPKDRRKVIQLKGLGCESCL